MEGIMIVSNELLEMWNKDSEIDRTEPGKALLDIPKLHSKYLAILSRHRLLSKECEFRFNQMKRLVFRFGETEKEVKDKLYERDIVLEFEKKVVYEN